MRAGARQDSKERYLGNKEHRSPVSSLLYYGGILAACFVLLVHVHYVIQARKLEFAIGRVMREQSQVRREIASEEIEISQLESIPRLLQRKAEEGIPLEPAKSPPLPYLARTEEAGGQRP
jgi:hypothetical protein